MESFYNCDKTSAAPVSDEIAISLGNAASHQWLSDPQQYKKGARIP